ncbi:MAG TPA: hypothetical protein VFG69_14590 [Nannocystaceae bacterium]|nr:hypothetical protein [Nannocystaceae bacterium]
MLAERRHQDVGDLDHPRLVVLRRIDGAAIVGRHAHVDAPRDEVDVLPAQRSQLAQAHPGLQAGQHHGAPRVGLEHRGAHDPVLHRQGSLTCGGSRMAALLARLADEPDAS